MTAKYKRLIIPSVLMALTVVSCRQASVRQGVLYECAEYTVTSDSVTQGRFTARAVSPLEIVTDYRSPDVQGASPLVTFRFSINSRDNEMAGGSHRAIIGDSGHDDRIYTFGRIIDEAIDSVRADEVGCDTLRTNTPWTVRVDMRPVLRSFDARGYYATPTGDTIYADDFKGLWVAGSVEPLNWDFENLYGKHDRKLTDRGDSIYEVTIAVNPPVHTQPDVTGWKIDSVNSAYPRYESGQVLMDAVYNMAIDNIVSDIRPDDTFRAGKEWDGVWTRDVAYSIYLSLALLDPERSMNSLRAKVANGRIVQDTGTGGAWPVSSDRVVWALAAWEVYKVTGDREWLAEAYDVIDRTLRDDLMVVWDPAFSLMHGEQSYLDWREQTYPRWAQPADIFESMCLGTNAVFSRAFGIAAEMARELGGSNVEYESMSKSIASAINDRLWIPNYGYYSEYLYGGVYPIQSHITDNLGQSLSILFGIATPEMAASIMSKTPRMVFGTPSVFPQSAEVKPYHNDATWPFVQAYWNLAAARTGNAEALAMGMASMYRAAALFATHKELFVNSTGDYRGTAVNSDAQLWSCAGAAAMNLRVIAGMDFTTEGIEFHPVVLPVFAGDKTLKGVRYRDALLDITVRGTGNVIAGFSIDGVPSANYMVPAAIEGPHKVEITLANNNITERAVNVMDPVFSPATPVVRWTDRQHAVIENATAGVDYLVYLNGVFQEEEYGSDYTLFDFDSYTVVNFAPVIDQRWIGYCSRPYQYFPAGSVIDVQAESFAKGGTRYVSNRKLAENFVELTREHNTHLSFDVTVDTEGEYFISVRYANGSGPINTENKCAIRTLSVNGERCGALVMPQRGIGEWLSTGFSNTLHAHLNKGVNRVSIDYVTPYNVNMNGTVNTALLDYVRIIRK